MGEPGREGEKGSECMTGEVEKERKGVSGKVERSWKLGVMGGVEVEGGREEKGAVFMLTSEVVQMSQAPEKVTVSGRKGIRET